MTDATALRLERYDAAETLALSGRVRAAVFKPNLNIDDRRVQRARDSSARRINARAMSPVTD
jgi:hypothetical protein